ncbi:MAG TPA: anthranilate phosphoribosyltransferase, partial [Rhizomicrobium sp.]|nr:anthranilate phosphoribosyltransferase [Rhizomicrobium sp.]
MTDTVKKLFARVIAGTSLDAEESALVFDRIMSGEADPAQLEAFLAAQAARGPSVAEITGAARSMRAHMRSIRAPEGAIDLCGTGGDGHGTLNVSTAVSFVVAGCGVAVAKHGNRSASSRAGAADVLEILGVPIDLSPEDAQAALDETGLCFLFAPLYHPAMKHVAQVRRALGRRTIFNLLGPLCNPAQVKRQLLGVYASEWLEPLAEVLRALGSEKACVVHGADGLDELSTTGVSFVATLERDRIATSAATPESAGLVRATLADLIGGDAAHNAGAILRLLGGEAGAF